MSTERIGLVGMSVENKQFFDLLLLSRAIPKFVHMDWGLKRPIPARGGNSIEWRRLEVIGVTTSALTEGTIPTATNVTFTNVAATVVQYGQFTKHSEVLVSQAIDPVVAELVEAYGESMGDSLDQVTRNVMVAGTTVQFASTAGSRLEIGSGMRMTFAEIREAVDTLGRNNARTIVDGKYISIVHPDTVRDMFGDSDILTSFQNAGPRDGSNPIITGAIGDLYMTRFVVTSNARIVASAGLSGADIYLTMFLGQEYYGITEFGALAARTFIKLPGSAGANDPLDQFGTVGWKASLAVARLNENFAVRVEHTTSRSNAA